MFTQLNSCEKKAWKQFQAWTGFEPGAVLQSKNPMQCFDFVVDRYISQFILAETR